ncbi:O-methyltransferase [Chelativorans salis]|uniref:Class I SAM-dependent methyltransferase n=1 Tax=Chelativorans salis TaxID=2978478 RepID=A0ABT2LIB8_9HYPH|nr:class I SAM-dependent methyltransferase [Chelativorans sp. EGI FJ00035]MCT7373754.1 class I SAM-dependent methyltransferase [Chelativorans sp. EGI FJ00035]
MAEATAFDFIQEATRSHRARHGCGAYTFEDGAGLIALASAHECRRAIELGTALGYTACCLASATDETLVDTIERDPRHVALARENVRKAGYDARITVHEGDFLAVMARLAGPYDLAFFDGFAPDRTLIARLRALLREEGVLVCANLALAGGTTERELEAEFANADHWSAIGRLEGGATRIYRKV